MRTMTEILSIAAMAATTFGASSVYAPQAKACTCLPNDVTSSYRNADEVLEGKVLFEFRGRQLRAYLVDVHQAYKGCRPSGDLVWLRTATSSAGCGADLDVGDRYLLHGTATRHPWLLDVSSCDYNRPASALSESDHEYLSGRTLCCDGRCECADGSQPFQCLVDPCEVAPPCADGTCTANYCGGCNAEFYDEAGFLVCNEQSCESNEDCRQAAYCGRESVCVRDGDCEIDVDCHVDGNDFPHPECVGHGFCTEDRTCGWECGTGVECVDYAGYDFGPCDAWLGAAVLDGTCQEISGCSGPLGPLFPSVDECQLACDPSALEPE
ncbi:MAG: hypothetical protein B7733_21630 [Myxococcales bacterium FL481]|nr:MAG: hypothetical protein B7733_21630 [Myxococcales bacterium FL481]